MILAIAIAVAVVLVPLTGGDLSRLADLHLRWWGLLPGAIGLQVAVMNTPTELVSSSVLGALHVVSYLMVFVALALNRHIDGWFVLAAGGLLNLVVIAANGGVMPADPKLWTEIGMPEPIEGFFENSAPMGDATLGFLGDVLVFPGPAWMTHLFSIGDAVLALGLIVVLQLECYRSRLPVTGHRV